jgi:hypothetical protein
VQYRTMWSNSGDLTPTSTFANDFRISCITSRWLPVILNQKERRVTSLTGLWKKMSVSFLGSTLATPLSVRDSAKLYLWDVLEGRVFKNELLTADDLWRNMTKICCSSSYHTGCNIREQEAVSCLVIIMFRGVRQQLEKCCCTQSSYISRTHKTSFSWCVNNSGVAPSQSFCTVRFLKQNFKTLTWAPAYSIVKDCSEYLSIHKPFLRADT